MQVAAAALLFHLSSDKRQRRCFFALQRQRQRRYFSSSVCPALIINMIIQDRIISVALICTQEQTSKKAHKILISQIALKLQS